MQAFKIADPEKQVLGPDPVPRAHASINRPSEEELADNVEDELSLITTAAEAKVIVVAKLLCGKADPTVAPRQNNTGQTGTLFLYIRTLQSVERVRIHACKHQLLDHSIFEFLASKLDQSLRIQCLQAFKEGTHRVLIAADILATKSSNHRIIKSWRGRRQRR